jgi:hypothetical protein
MFDELEILVPGQVSDVGCAAGDQIIDGNDPMTFRQQTIAQMRSQKPSGAGHDGNRFLCGHCAIYLMVVAKIASKKYLSFRAKSRNLLVFLPKRVEKIRNNEMRFFDFAQNDR